MYGDGGACDGGDSVGVGAKRAGGGDGARSAKPDACTDFEIGGDVGSGGNGCGASRTASGGGNTVCAEGKLDGGSIGSI